MESGVSVKYVPHHYKIHMLKVIMFHKGVCLSGENIYLSTAVLFVFLLTTSGNFSPG